jgi:hypothetical protein
MAREGLRTLVVAKKVLTEDQYVDFEVLVNECHQLATCAIRHNQFVMFAKKKSNVSPKPSCRSKIAIKKYRTLLKHLKRTWNCYV